MSNESIGRCTCQTSCPDKNSCPIICSGCNKLIPFKLYNPFKLFNIPQQFDIKLEDLEQQFYKLQKLCHPDNYTSSIEQQLIAQQYSTYINESYNKLKSPVTRAETLLQLTHSFNKEDKHATIQDEKLLLKIMNLREKLDTLTAKDKLKQFKKEITKQQQNIIQQLSIEFQQKNLNKIKKLIVTLIYMNKISYEIKEKNRTITRT